MRFARGGRGMLVETLSYDCGGGWSAGFPDLDSPETLLLVFGAPELMDHAEPFEELRLAFPESLIAGCSTSGEIHQGEIRDGTLAVAAVRFERSRLCQAAVRIDLAGDSYSVGQALVRKLREPELKGLLVLSEGTHVNGSELLRGIRDSLPEDVVVTGGLAGDFARFERTWVLADGLPQTHLVSAVALSGENLRLGHGSRGGWDIFGPERVITEAKDNILYRLDNRPALELYKEYLGERASELPAAALLFPLALRAHREDSKQIVRTILGVDDRAQSMTFAGNMPQGYLAQMMRANFDRLVDGASIAAENALGGVGGADSVLSLAISCVGRRLVLQDRTEEELEATLDILPSGTQQIGFYSHGEISPFETGSCELHNQTMTLTTIAEELA